MKTTTVNALRRLCAAFLALCLLMMLPLTAFAEGESGGEVPRQETVSLRTVEDVARLAVDCRLDSWSQNRTVVLENDIDLTGSGFAGIPIFSGTFEGQGHTISGLTLMSEGSVVGFFRYIQKGALVRDLTVKGRAMPTGTRNTVGGIAGSNAGTLQNCVFDGVAAGAATVGGVAGTNTVSGVISGCKSGGSAYGSHFVGGIAGENAGVITGCTNSANVNTTVKENEVELSDLTLDDLTDTENAADITDVGGVAGTSSGVLRASINRGTVGYSHIGYNIGGIVGSQTGYVEGCINYGEIYGRKEAGGIVGQLEPNSILQYSTDTLQILQGQLDTLQDLTDKACNDAEAAGSELSNQLNSLQSKVDGARSAVQQLMEQAANGVSLGTKTLTTDLSALFPQGDIEISANGPTPTPAPQPTESPVPSGQPSPSEQPTSAPTEAPTEQPTEAPTQAPTEAPTEVPTEAPPEETEAPTEAPGDAPAAHGKPAPAAQAQAMALEGEEGAGSALPEISPLPSALPLPSELPTALPSALPIPSGLPTALPDLPTEIPLPSFDPNAELSLEVPSVELTNQDGITAARNDLGGSLTDLVGSFTSLNTSSTGSSQALINDVRAITAQINKIGQTLAGAVDDAQNTDADDIIQDVSDSDTEQDTEGKIYNCVNAGNINADINAGGIAGAMAPENDLDPEDDIQIAGSDSLNFTYKTRAVVRACTNRGTITAKKQNAGGIVGSMEMGTVWECHALGMVDAPDADCVGGIVGKSSTTIRQSTAKCQVAGANQVGGIAGSATNLSDCRSLVRITAGTEALGAIAGSADFDKGELSGNYFVSDTLGGIDGVSYAGLAQPLAYEDFMTLGDLPQDFAALTLHFTADGVKVANYKVQYGAEFPDSQLPEIPQKDGYSAAWPDFGAGHVVFDEAIEAVYTPLATVLESTQIRDDRAILLVEGNFTETDSVSLTTAAEGPALLPGAELLESWQVSFPADGAQSHTARYLAPAADAQAEVWVKAGDSWQKAGTTRDGSYLVFTMPGGTSAFCAVRQPAAKLPWLCAAGGLAAALVLAGFLLHRKRRRAKAKANKA